MLRMLVLLLVAVLSAGLALAQRVALVVGNGGYPGDAALRNPLNDARRMAALLERELGFRVITVPDAKLADFDRALDRFRDAARGADVALFFYAGHGMEVGGENLLVPTDARFADEREARRATVPLREVQQAMAAARIKVVLLDACRDNPLERRMRRADGLSRGGSRGLAPAEEAENEVIAFATTPGRTAADGTGENSPFTTALLQHLPKPGEDIQLVLTDVAETVRQMTEGRQRPWRNTNAVSRLVLKATPAVASLPQPAPAAPPAPPAQPASVTPAPVQPPTPAPAPTPEAVEAALALGREQWRGIQRQLDALGHDVGEPDGLVGRRTRLAVAAYQRSQRVAETGFVDQPLLASLQLAAAEPLRRLEEERTAWEQAQGSQAGVEGFLRRFPSGRFAEAARARLEEFRSGTAPGAVRPASAAVGRTFRDCADCPEMVVIPAGSFVMGSPASEEGRRDNEGPQRRVTLREPLAVGKYHVTVGEYRAFVQATGRADGGSCYIFDGQWREQPGRSWRSPGFQQTERDPVVCVSWEEARAYAAWVSQRTGKGYRLLTEAEFEYAARGETTSRWWWGEDAAGQCRAANGADQTGFPGNAQVAQCADGYARTSPVGSFVANRYGLHDMAGNAWQWVQDCYRDSYAGAPADASVAVEGGDCSRRVLRGGSWNYWPQSLRSAVRYGVLPVNRGNDVGFRVARTPG